MDGTLFCRSMLCKGRYLNGKWFRVGSDNIMRTLDIVNSSLLAEPCCPTAPFGLKCLAGISPLDPHYSKRHHLR